MQRLQVSFLARAAVGRSVPAHAVDSHSPLHTCTVASAAHLAAMQPSTPLTCICVRAGPGCCRRRAKGMLRVGGHVRAARRPQVRAASVLLHVAAPSTHPYSGGVCREGTRQRTEAAVRAPTVLPTCRPTLSTLLVVAASTGTNSTVPDRRDAGSASLRLTTKGQIRAALQPCCRAADL